MPESFLQDLIKLASLGTSGICIFVVFWVGYLIQKTNFEKEPYKRDTLRSYMWMCFAIAVVTALSGGANAYFNARTIADTKAKNEELTTTVQKKDTELTTQQERMASLVKHLDIVLKDKRVQAESTSASPTVKQSIKVLEDIVKAEKPS
jgi:hypothetical protein